MNSDQRSPIEKFQSLLRELFQFDCADLDFGIYRIMNHKRDVVERFISTKLPEAVDAELGSGTLSQQAEANAALEEARRQVFESLGPDALDADGEVTPALAGTPVAETYLTAKARAGASRSREALETDVYNHLYAFFNRYYQDGDFVSKRRYSRNHRYAIPYNGEEVHLHWANSDQYYIKTDEHFHSYQWKSPTGVTVHFRVNEANLDQNNVKGERRFFVPEWADANWELGNRTLTVPFSYRPLNAAEGAEHGRSNQQEGIIAASLDQFPTHVKDPDALAALTSERSRNAADERVTHLEHHLRRYTRRNDSDFFIHKNLGPFLFRELDFYLKNEVLNLENMEIAGEHAAEGWFQLLRLIKTIGSQIIDFLAQIEGFQKMLWEKRKLVTETNYCIALRCIPEEFHGEIAANEAQWAEWRSLSLLDDEAINLADPSTAAEERISHLKLHGTLMLDTAHFPKELVDRLLAFFDDLDKSTDGLLVHGDNWQAPRLLQGRYQDAVQCVHIDPPYNTATSGFLYKNNYQHSSWLAMMHDRVEAGIALMQPSGAFLCHIDENEYERLHVLFSHMGIPDGGTIVWDKKNPMLGRRQIATQHEYVLWRTWNEASVFMRSDNVSKILERAALCIRLEGGVNDRSRKKFRTWLGKQNDFSGGERAYEHIEDDGRVFQSVAMGAPEPREDRKFHIPLMHPKTNKPCPVPPSGWSRAPETMRQLVEKKEVIFGKDESIQPRRKVYLSEDTKRQMPSVIRDSGRGKGDLDKLGLVFPYNHPVSLYEELIGSAAAQSDAYVMDHFAGSGTTAHAVVNLNRADGGKRKFILTEFGEQFDAVLLPRVKKIAFSPLWSNAKPQEIAVSDEVQRLPQVIKYIRLESYEDALDSIEFDQRAGELELEEKIEGYLLNYMLKWETKDSETLLNPSKLMAPFDYRLRVHANGDTVERGVDVAETFNYLLGLKVRTRRVYMDKDRRYLAFSGETREQPGRTTVVIWRNTADWEEADLKRDREFVAENGITEGADTIYVNGMSSILRGKPIEPLFKERMFAGVSDPSKPTNAQATG
ncbi:MAG: DNA methyltransferase [Gammaproteobacteria bacterium]|nr:DNA methyltransferase [Gammaproteobacteria bacterium]